MPAPSRLRYCYRVCSAPATRCLSRLTNFLRAIAFALGGNTNARLTRAESTHHKNESLRDANVKKKIRARGRKLAFHRAKNKRKTGTISTTPEIHAIRG